MDIVLQGCEEFAAVYLDDVVIYRHTWVDHLQHVRQTLEKMQAEPITQDQKGGAFLYRIGGLVPMLHHGICLNSSTLNALVNKRDK